MKNSLIFLFLMEATHLVFAQCRPADLMKKQGTWSATHDSGRRPISAKSKAAIAQIEQGVKQAIPVIYGTNLRLYINGIMRKIPTIRLIMAI